MNNMMNNQTNALYTQLLFFGKMLITKSKYSSANYKLIINNLSTNEAPKLIMEKVDKIQ